MNMNTYVPTLAPADVPEVVDQATAKVAAIEYERLSVNGKMHNAIDRIGETVLSFDSLKNGIMSNYDSWHSLMYMTWYQPHHINLAYTLLATLSEKLNGSSASNLGYRKLRLIDLGCGNLSMHIAVKLALATGILRVGPNVEVESIGIDPSTEMTKLGSRLSDELDRLRPALAQPDVSFSVFKDAEEYQAASIGNDNEAVNTIVGAMHVFYPSNVNDIKRQLATLRDLTNPSAVIVTAHPNTFTTVNRVITPTPKKFTTSHHGFGAASDLSFAGELPLTTAFRSGLAHGVEQRRTENFEEWLDESAHEMRSAVGYSDVNPEEWNRDVHSLIEHLGEEDKTYISETDKAISYLRNPVRWSGADVTARIYERF